MSGIIQGLIASLKSAAASATDIYFNLVTLLLNTTSTNGAQNNTFLDSSSNAFSITRNGNTTQGTFTPFSQTGWSNYFNGTNSFLTVPDNNAYSFTGDFCIEAFIYLNALPAESAVFSQWFGGSVPNTAMYFYINSSGRIVFITGVSSTQTTITATSTTVSANQWAHVAVCRSGTTVRLFVNGVADTTTGTVSGTINNIAYTPQIGNLNNQGSSANFLNGYISNLRVTNGALYTSNFTPSTTPLTTTVSAGSVILLTCQSNSFIDNSSNAFTVTLGGTPSIQAFSPFAPTAAYSTTTVGGSGYFDGSGDSLASTTDFESSTSISTFTIEGWVYPTTFSTLINVIGGMVVSSGDQKSIAAEVNTSGQVALYWFDGAVKRCTGNTAMRLNAWNYFAIVVTSNAIAIYVNKTTADTLSGTTTLTTRTQLTDLGVGAYYNNNTPAQYFNGYLASVRYSTVARTISSIPTAPLSSDSDVRWLINFTNAGIYDAAAKNDLETVGNAQVSTTQAKFGTTSMYFDGTGDWLLMPDSPNLQLGTGDFTIDGWIYLTATGVAYGIISKGAASTGWSVNVTSGNKLQFSYTATALTGATSLAATTWYYFAVVRSGSATGNLKVYLNGSVDATSGGAVTDNFNQTEVMYVGASRTGTTALNGYLDEVRITKGVARTVTTTPTAAFPIQ